jgi:hypothetical protein
VQFEQNDFLPVLLNLLSADIRGEALADYRSPQCNRDERAHNHFNNASERSRVRKAEGGNVAVASQERHYPDEYLST